MKDMVKKANLDKEFLICSSATSREEIGNDTHYGTKRILDKMGIPYTKRRAVQITKADYEKYDFIIGMDSYNIKNIFRIVGGDSQNKVGLLLHYAGIDRDVADPWYTGDFDSTYRDISLGCRALLNKLTKN